jgi:hypothetical protein
LGATKGLGASGNWWRLLAKCRGFSAVRAFAEP